MSEQTKNINRVARFIKTFQLNSDQLAFGSYAAELSYYIISAIVPILLAFTNVVALLPIGEGELLSGLQMVLPAEVEDVMLPLIESYLENVSTTVFSVGLLISLWPASNAFNTIQRVLNTIYKAEPRQNFFFQRVFSYIFTLVIVVVVAAFSFVVLFGETVLRLISDYINFDLSFFIGLLQGGLILGIIGAFVLLVLIYKFMPNVNWPIKYSIPGAAFSLVGFFLVSQLFSIYVSFANNLSSNSAIGVFIIVLVWLYLNATVFAVGGYINVLYHDYKTKSYRQMVAEVVEFETYESSSDDFNKTQLESEILHHRIRKSDSQDSTKEILKFNE